MRAVVQRVHGASVRVANRQVGAIGRGLLVFLGIGMHDTRADLEYMAAKLINLRLFDDPRGKMNLSIRDVRGEILVVSQFTLFGDCRKGRRPSFTDAAPPGKARQLYDDFVILLQEQGIAVATGVFQEMMEVSLVNDGPVTFILDSSRLF
jgi:D-tyrosyl-tRNA(Tyr) deacylase